MCSGLNVNKNVNSRINLLFLGAFGWNTPTKIKLIREVTFSLTSNLYTILMQKFTNCVNPRYIQYLHQCLLSRPTLDLTQEHPILQTAQESVKIKFVVSHFNNHDVLE